MFNYDEDFYIDFYKKIIQSNVFSSFIKYFYEFPWNNIFQSSFLEILTEILNYEKFNKMLLDHIFLELGFLDEIILCVIDEKYHCISKFNFSKKEIQNGFLPFIIEIICLINDKKNNQNVAEIINKGIFYW